MDGWYYTQQGQSVGPISLDQLKALTTSGQVGADVQVWHATMSNWMPAHLVPALAGFGAAAPGVTMALPAETGHAGYLGYSGTSTASVVATPAALESLRATRPWAIFIAVMIFISSAFMVVSALVMLIGGPWIASMNTSRSPSNLASGAGFMMGMGVVYLVLATFNMIMGLMLMKFASAIGRLMTSRQPIDLENAMAAQKSFWKLTGIAIISIIVLYFISIAFIVGSGVFR